MKLSVRQLKRLIETTVNEADSNKFQSFEIPANKNELKTWLQRAADNVPDNKIAEFYYRVSEALNSISGKTKTSSYGSGGF